MEHKEIIYPDFNLLLCGQAQRYYDLADDPSSPYVYGNYCTCLLMLERYDELIELCTQYMDGQLKEAGGDIKQTFIGTNDYLLLFLGYLAKGERDKAIPQLLLSQKAKYVRDVWQVPVWMTLAGLLFDDISLQKKGIRLLKPKVKRSPSGVTPAKAKWMNSNICLAYYICGSCPSKPFLAEWAIVLETDTLAARNQVRILLYLACEGYHERDMEKMKDYLGQIDDLHERLPIVCIEKEYFFAQIMKTMVNAAPSV